jgi:hypothetical protein
MRQMLRSAAAAVGKFTCNQIFTPSISYKEYQWNHWNRMFCSSATTVGSR